jgi:hypothetical protein
MERLFEEWFVTLDELKGVCDALEARRIRAPADRSDYLLDATGGLQPPRPTLVNSVLLNLSSRRTFAGRPAGDAGTAAPCSGTQQPFSGCCRERQCGCEGSCHGCQRPPA